MRYDFEVEISSVIDARYLLLGCFIYLFGMYDGAGNFDCVCVGSNIRLVLFVS